MSRLKSVGVDIGKLGVWSVGIRQVADPSVAAAAEGLERSGFGAIWYSAGSGTKGFDIGEQLLKATTSISVATGITSIWATTAEQSSGGFARLDSVAAGRFLLGIGVSHEPMVNASGQGTYQRPVHTMKRYLAALNVPRDRRILAALGPKMLEVAASESLGTHPYLVTPTMTAAIRAALPAGTVVAVEQGVVVSSDASTARAIARANLKSYLALPNYVNNWLRHGYGQNDVAEGGSDRLVDDLIVWGDPSVIAQRIHEHYAAGADHVCIQVFEADARALPVQAWRDIASEVL